MTAVFSLAAVASLFAASCASLSTDSVDTVGCVNKIAGDEVKAQLEEIVDRFTKHDPGPQTTVLIRQSCHEQIYRRGTDRIVIYNLAGTRDAAYYAGIYQIVVHGYAEHDHGDLTPAEAATCLTRARADLVAIGVGADTLNAYRKKFGDVADDPDLGPVHFLNCSDSGEPSYQKSLDTMVHELTHQNTENNCLYTGYAPGRVCFALSGDLPSSSIATVEQLFDSDDPYLKKLSKAQQLYLFQFNKQNRGPAALFNELNAYTAGLEVSAAILKRNGTKGLLDKEGQPPPQVLPLVMLWTAKYLGELRDEYSELYSSSFGPSTENRMSVETLLTRGETAYQNWSTELAEHKLSAIPSERALWQQYLDAKKNLEQPNA